MQLRILLVILILMGLASCKKTADALYNPDSQITFFNTSEYAIQSMESGSACYLLIDSTDSTLIGQYSGLYTLPSFSVTGYDFPALGYTNNLGSPPFLTYMRMHIGAHSVTLTDTNGRAPLLTNHFHTIQGVPQTLIFTDSMGLMRTIITRDSVTNDTLSNEIRVLNLSPDAGSVFLKLNGGIPVGFPVSLAYGQVSQFVRYPNNQFDTLVVQVFNVGDTVDVIASNYLVVSPGHAYEIMLTGYLNTESYPDPFTGNTLTAYPDIKTILTQIN
jgi:hypothetical protein